MRLFRRKEETLNEQLLREAGLDDRPPEAKPASAFANLPRSGPGRFGIQLPSTYSGVFDVVEAPGIEGDRIAFAALPDGSLVVDEETGDASLGPIADAVERRIPPPYRAEGVRDSATRWNVSANPIEVVELQADGDTIELTSNDGVVKATVDGRAVDRRYPELEQDGDYVVRATRLDGDLWEIQTSLL